jgi:hypothetical protein
MRELHLVRKPIDKSQYVKRTALLSDVNQVITDDCIIYENNQPILFYTKIKEDTSPLRWAAKHMKYPSGTRTNGLATQSKVFGYSPRIPMRNDYCTVSAMATQYPKNHHVITNFAEQLKGYYETYFPQKYKEHEEMVKEKVLEDWKIGNSPFTSGIVNKNNPLKYHYDSGNFKGMLSNMVVFKSDVEGGYLVIPELDLALEVADNTLTIFNGQDILHGVSPIEYKNSMSYRFSVVYYSLEQMWKCEPIQGEIERVRRAKTKKEQNRLDPEHLASLTKQFKKNKK